MNLGLRVLALTVAMLVSVPLAAAEDTPNPCGSSAVTSGSGDVMVEGEPAARAGDPLAAPAPSPMARRTCS